MYDLILKGETTEFKTMQGTDLSVIPYRVVIFENCISVGKMATSFSQLKALKKQIIFG